MPLQNEQNITSKYDHITVCICTYKRPKLLERLLNELQNQTTDDFFTYSIVVVDNDHNQSAKNTVAASKKKSSIAIEYYHEPEQNIALARNKAVENAKGNFIAFIDDDEFPITKWLLELYKACTKYGADGVLGPVKPYFEQEPPAWIVKGRFCEREEHPTGTVLHWGNTRTGNVLFDIRLFNENRFDAKFGKTGGEDIEFFKKAMEQGRMFVWCNEAVAHETVPPERWTMTFYLKKYLRIGGLVGEKVKKDYTWINKYILKAISAFIIYIFILPFSLLGGQHIYMRCFVKVLYNLALILGFLGFVLIRNRDEIR